MLETFVELKRVLSFNAIKIIVLLTLVTSFYFQDFILVFENALNDPTTSYILFIPFLIIYVLYRKRNIICAVMQIDSGSKYLFITHSSVVLGVLIFLTSIFLYFFGSYTFSPLQFHLVTLPIFVVGLVLIFFNFSTLRQLSFPIFFLFFINPPPSAVLDNLGAILSVISAEFSVAFLNLVGISASINESALNPIIVLITPNQTTMSFVVDLTCSGINSLITFLIVSVFLTFIIRDKLWKKIGLLSVSIPIIYSLNIIRISTLLFVGYTYGEEIVQTLFHTTSGLIISLIGALIILLVAKYLFKANFYLHQRELCNACSVNEQDHTFCRYCGRFLKANRKTPKKTVMKITVIVVIVASLIVIQAPIFALSESSSNLLKQLEHDPNPTTQILPQIEGYDLKFEYRDSNFESVYERDAVLTYSYIPFDGTLEKIWIVIEIAQSQSSFHRWESCLITYPLTHGDQAQATQIDLVELQLMPNPPIFARYFAFRWNRYNTLQTVVYWRETLIFTSDTFSQQKQLQISAVIYPDTIEQIPKSKTMLEETAKLIADYWGPFKDWKSFALLFSQYSNFLVLIPISGIVILLVFNQISRKNTSMVAYKKLSNRDKAIIVALDKTQRTSLPVGKNVFNAHQKNHQGVLNISDFFLHLKSLNNIGLVKLEIWNIDDNPVQVWTTDLRNLGC